MDWDSSRALDFSECFLLGRSGALFLLFGTILLEFNLLLSAVAAVTALLGLLGRLTLFVEDVCV
jgi:hypothetical protein